MSEQQNQDVAAAEFAPAADDADHANDAETVDDKLNMVAEIPVRIDAELGYTRLPIRELLSLGPGSVVELDRLAGESIDLLVNGVLVGHGDVVIVNESFGVRITDIIHPEQRLNSLTD
jgi:flagellar motor switch protein FliN/FliY